MIEAGKYRGVAEFFDRTSASIYLYDNNNARYYIARIPISDFRKNKIPARQGIALEIRVNNSKFRLIKELNKAFKE